MNFDGQPGAIRSHGSSADGDGHSHAATFTIPDAHLLFSGEFQRSGSDLIVSDQTHRVVVPDYFHGEKRPALVSPEGAPLDPKVIDALTGHVQYAQAGPAAAAKVVGHVVKMTGSASIVRNGVTVDLNNGDVVYQNDVVQTGSGSTLGLVMIDGTTFNLTANARLMMNDLTYDATSTSNTALFTLVQGAASFVAGQVAKTGDMKVSTPVATMGIRGTAVILDVSAVDGTVSVSVVNQRDGQLHAVEVYNTRGDRIGTVTSNGSVLTLTPTASFELIAQESNKSVAQVISEFNAFQQLLSTYDIGKQIRPDTPAPTDGRRGDNDQQPLTKFAGSTISPIDSSVTKYNEPIGGTKDAKGGATDDVAALKPTGDGPGTTTKILVNVGDAPAQVVEVAATSIPFVVSPSPVSRISTGSGDHFGPVMSADGQFVTYDPDGAIYLFDRQTGATKTIAAPGDGFTYGSPTISADGHFIVYQGSDGTQSFIFIYNNDASDPAHYGHTIQLASGGQPAISGDGSRIVIEQDGAIALFDQQGHQLANFTVTALGIAGALWKPAISADGHIIAFWNSDQSSPGGAGQLFTYDLSSATLKSIAHTATGAGDSAASFSADGHHVVYQSEAPGGHPEIYLTDLRTGNVVFHTDNSAASTNPVISPDGHFIIFASDARLTGDDSNNFADVYVVDVTDPSRPVYKLVSVLDDGTQGDAASDLGATISAGGQFVAFGSRASNFSTGDTNGGGDIFVVDPSSGHSAIILEGRNSPATLTASGVIRLTGEHTGLTLGSSDSRVTASFDSHGDIQWSFSEQRSDFASLQPGDIAVRNFTITLHSDRATTEIPVKVSIYDVDQAPVPVADAAPVASPVTLAAGTEDTTATVFSAALLAGVVDIDGPSLSITGLSVSSGGGTIVDNHDGTFSYTPVANYNGPVVFNYTASDGTLPASSTASLNIAAVNDAPVVTKAALAVSEGGTVVLTAASIGVSDPDSASISFSVSNVSHGKFQTSADGANWIDATSFTAADLAAAHVRFVHDGGETAPTFSIQADDGGTANHLSDVVAGTVNFTNVNDAPVAASSGNAALGDEDHTISGNVPAGSDVDDASGLTYALEGAPDPAKGALTFNSDGTFSFAPAANFNGTASFSYRVVDPHGAHSDPQDFVITVNPVNDAPVAASSGNAASGDEDHTISGNVPAGSDVDDASGLTYALESGPDAAKGALTFNSDGTFSFAPAANFNGTASFSYRVVDPHGAQSGPQSFVITINPVNDAPVVTAGHTLNYTENQAATAIDPAITVSDVDSVNLVSATVQITGNYVNGEDVLGFTSQNGITGSFDTAIGKLTLSGSSSVANYQAALASVSYVNTSDSPSGADRTVTIVTNDGAASSAAVTETIHVTPVNDAPVATAGHTLAYTENDAATAIDTAITVTDVDNANMASATVAITSGFASGQDVLDANVTGTTILKSYNAATGVLTLTGNDTKAHYQQVLDSVSYFNSSDNPSGADRTVTITVNDGAASSAAVTETIHVTPVNDAPVATAGHTLAYTENDAATAIDTAITVTDVDNANMASATVAITSGFASGQDVLDANVTGTTILKSYNAATGVLTLTGNDTKAHYQQVLDSVSYFNSSDNPSAADRIVSYTVNDGALDSAAATETIHVTPVNDAPSITAQTLASITEDDGDPAGRSVADIFGAGFQDVDGPGLKGIAVVGDDSTADQGVWQYRSAGGSWEAIGTVDQEHALIFAVDTELRFVPAPDFNGTPGSLQVVGVDDSYDEEFTTGAAQQGGRYTEDVSVRGGATPFSDQAVTLGISVAAVNDAPAGGDSTVTTLEDTPYTFTTSDFGFSDPDDLPANSLLAVKIAGVAGGGKLTDNGVAVTAGQFVSANDIVAGLLKFTPSADANGLNYAGVSFQIRDDGGTANGGVDLDQSPNTITFNVTPVNDAPVAVPDTGVSITQNGGVGVSFSPILNAFATGIGSEYVITQAVNSQVGALWSNSKISLNASFTISAELFFGASDSGADGFTFIIQNHSKTTIGNAGGGLGYEGIAQSVAIEFDTYDNGPGYYNDIANDHAAFDTNGSMAGIRAPINLGNIEDGQYHPVTIDWNAATHVITLSYNGAVIGTQTIDVAATVGGNEAYIGFAGSTGGANNLQKIRNLGYQSADHSVVLDVVANDTDVDAGDKATLHVVAASSAGGASLTFSGLAGAGIVYSPGDVFDYLAAGESTTDTVTYTIEDSHGAQSTSTAQVTIIGLNDAPVIQGGDSRSLSVAENTTAVTTVVAQDIDGPSLSWSVVTGSGSPDASKFTIDPATGALSFRSAPDFGNPTDSNHNNIYTVQVNVTDGTLSDTQTLFVHVTDVNDNAPVITTSSSQSVAENNTFVTHLSAFDVDSVGGPTGFSIANGLDGGLFEIVNGNLQFRTAPDFEHPADADHDNVYSVTVNASDGLNSSTKTLFVQVSNVNEAPVLAPDTAAVTYTENASALALMSGGTVTDPDNPSNFDDGSLSVTLNGAISGDELVLASTGGVSISGSSVKVGGTTVGTISGNHSTHLTVDFNANATDARVESVLHALAFDSTSDNPTNADRTAIVTFNDGSNDGSGPALSDSSTVTIHVGPVNDAPHAVDDVVITNNANNSTYKIPEWVLLANDTDPDSAVLDVTLISSPSGFASVDLNSNPGSVTIHDNAPVGGSFTYTASDGSSTATAHVTVTQASGTMNGGSGNEIFIGDSSGSTINAKAGDDILIGNGGDDTLDGGPGNDIYVFGLADGRDTIAHSSGVDTIRIAAGGAALSGLGFAEDAQDNLVIQFNGQQITVTNQFDDSTVGALKFDGGALYAGYDLGGDIYSVSGDSGSSRSGTSGNDILAGDAVGNTISGGDGKDLLFGNAGNDTLNGGSGNDLLVGGPGNDTFVFAAGSGRDTVSDFIPGQDKISLDYHAFDAGNFSSWLTTHAASVNSGHDVLIDLNVDGLHPGVDTILLQNVGAVANLHAGDFIVH